MKMFWSKSGDWLALQPVNLDLAMFWINELNKSKLNCFQINNSRFDISALHELTQHLLVVDEFLTHKLKLTNLTKYIGQDYFDQEILNNIHRDWIALLQTFPTIGNLMQLHKVWQDWNQINKKIHQIEESFSFSIIAKQYWEVDNPFGTQVLSFDHAQVEFVFSQKGRTTYNKWANFDNQHNTSDTNNFLQIGNELTVNLRRPITMSPPGNFVSYCERQKIPVVGNRLPLANFCNYEQQLTTQRHVIAKNLLIENNCISFET